MTFIAIVATLTVRRKLRSATNDICPVYFVADLATPETVRIVRILAVKTGNIFFIATKYLGVRVSSQ